MIIMNEWLIFGGAILLVSAIFLNLITLVKGKSPGSFMKEKTTMR